MAVTGDEIRRGLAELAARWGGYEGSERAEAQAFLNELLACYGTERRAVGARFEESTRSGGFIDMVWPRVCIFEMKRPSESNRLVAHRQQAIGYWRESGTPEAPAPRYVVLCSFHRFEVWEPGAVYNAPRVEFDLAELPERLDALLFLAGRAPYFAARRQTICAQREIGLTALYNEVDDGAYADLGALHDHLNRAVATAYGWPASAASDADESNRRLLELNGAITRGEVDYDPFST